MKHPYSRAYQPSFPSLPVVVGDDTGDEIVLGRNVLNRLHLALDGPAQVTEIR